MRRGTTGIVILAAALILAGCRPAGEEMPETETVEAHMETETEAETESESETQAAEEERTRTIIGVLEEFTTDRLVLLSDNGNELAFSTANAEIDLPCGTRVGNMVSVDYIGEITADGTGGAEMTSAVRIAGSADTAAEIRKNTAEKKETANAPENESEGETAESSENESEGETTERPENESENKTSEGAETEGAAGKDSGEEEKIIEGTLSELTMSTILVKKEDGQEITFSTVNVPVYFAGGLSAEMPVRITYYGSFEGGNAAVDSVEVVEITDAHKKSEQQSEGETEGAGNRETSGDMDKSGSTEAKDSTETSDNTEETDNMETSEKVKPSDSTEETEEELILPKSEL